MTNFIVIFICSFFISWLGLQILLIVNTVGKLISGSRNIKKVYKAVFFGKVEYSEIKSLSVLEYKELTIWVYHATSFLFNKLIVVDIEGSTYVIPPFTRLYKIVLEEYYRSSAQHRRGTGSYLN